MVYDETIAFLDNHHTVVDDRLPMADSKMIPEWQFALCCITSTFSAIYVFCRKISQAIMGTSTYSYGSIFDRCMGGSQNGELFYYIAVVAL